MTAEIAIMNLQAIALAADSAVTVRMLDGSSKIFTQANKLFALSKVAPVGILTYGNASFMGIPWETLVKAYRHNLGTSTFPNLHDYMDSFCDFLSREAVLHITPEVQEEFAIAAVRQKLTEIEATIQDKVRSELVEIMTSNIAIDADVLNRRRIEIQARVTNEVFDNAAIEGFRATNSSTIEKLARKSMRRRIASLRKEIFQRDLPTNTVRKINRIAIRIASGLNPNSFTGIAIAGFGDQEVFPSITEMYIGEVVQGIVKQRPGRENTMSHDNSALVLPFAQFDMVQQFMEGIAPEHEEFITRSFAAYLRAYSDNVLKVFGDVTSLTVEHTREIIEELMPQIVQSFNDNFVDFRRASVVRQIVDAVEMLPKEHLAEMAEALVNLTSLKRRVSLQEETVGGPTDVAVITKGDGMVWIKRKQYFPPELNHGYFARTYGRTGYGSGSIQGISSDTGGASDAQGHSNA